METIINEQYNNLERIISSTFSSSWTLLLFGCCTTVMIGSSVVYVYIKRRRRRSNTTSNKSSHISSSFSSNNNSLRYDSNDNNTTTTTTTSENNNNNNKPMDAWEERRSRGVAIHSLHERKDVNKSSKPFGSSYYYAHNSTKVTGGYTDGLRMEDYTMNQPRLLSKRIINDNNTDNNTTTTAVIDNAMINTEDRREDKVNDVIRPTSIVEQKRILNISKYLWDDPGSTDGIATIRIDVLPLNSTDNIPFENIRSYIHSDNIHTQILNNNEGLLIDIKTNATTDKTTNINYRLKIDSLYGPITSIKVIIKSKRLLIKLTKKYTMFDKSNLKSWPYPQKKKKCF